MEYTEYTNLQNQNKLQQDQILELAHFLNLTMVQVGEHQDVLTADPEQNLYINYAGSLISITHILSLY